VCCFARALHSSSRLLFLHSLCCSVVRDHSFLLVTLVHFPPLLLRIAFSYTKTKQSNDNPTQSSDNRHNSAAFSDNYNCRSLLYAFAIWTPHLLICSIRNVITSSASNCKSIPFAFTHVGLHTLFVAFPSNTADNAKIQGRQLSKHLRFGLEVN
jgi:hypothetical protein